MNVFETGSTVPSINSRARVVNGVWALILNTIKHNVVAINNLVLIPI
jgi:hypothetical protein